MSFNNKSLLNHPKVGDKNQPSMDATFVYQHHNISEHTYLFIAIGIKA
jgi:hypothetical protein